MRWLVSRAGKALSQDEGRGMATAEPSRRALGRLLHVIGARFLGNASCATLRQRAGPASGLAPRTPHVANQCPAHAR